MKYRLLLFILALLLTTSMPVGSASDPVVNILVLHSYNIDFSWTEDQHNAFISELQNSGIPYRLSVEIMDTKKYSNKIDSASFYSQITQKHQNKDYDLIYATDNDALNFLLQYKALIFPNVPVVASGINAGTEFNNLDSNTHIILEEADFIKTTSYLLKNQPAVKNLYIINDRSTTGKIVKAQIEKTFPSIYPELNLHWIEDRPISEFKAILSNLTTDDGVLYTIYFSDSHSEIYQYNESAEAAAEYSPVPVWCSWSFSMNTGCVGGRLASADQQGYWAARAAVDILNDRPVSQFISTALQLNQTIIDYAIAERFGIFEDIFPPDTVFLNRPLSYVEKNRTLLTLFGVVFSIMTVIILILSKVIHDQKTIHQKNAELLLLKTALITNQKEIVFKMGELIETRSHDTGNHVRRVALICRALGKKAGLSDEDVQTLENASPMHDVGKIAIPESILGKPGKLSVEERSVMDTHTSLGYEIFKNSDLPVFHAAAIIAHQHHEYWDGKGYPNRLAKDDIHIMARITALADVYDALLSKRPYKKPWRKEEAVSFILSQREQMFDPILVDHFIAILPEIDDIREAYQDYELNENMCPLPS